MISVIDDLKINGLGKDILSYDINEKMVERCKSRLDEIAIHYSIADVKWNIKCADFLTESDLDQFEYIIGNPPYIAYSDLPGDVQQYVKIILRPAKKVNLTIVMHS